MLNTATLLLPPTGTTMISHYLVCLFASATSPDSFHPLFHKHSLMEGKNLSLLPNLLFIGKEKGEKTKKKRQTQNEKKESKGRKDRTDSPCPAGICVLLSFDMRHSTCASGWECLVACFLVPSIILSRREGAGSVRTYRPTLACIHLCS